MKKKLINWLCLLGVFQFVFYILHDIIGGLNYPNYSWLNQAVSDLTASNSPSLIIADGLSDVYALFAILSMSMLLIIIQKVKSRAIRIGVYLFTSMTWVSAMGYSLFPLSEGGYAGKFTDIMHLYVVTFLIVALSISSLIFMIVGGFKNKYNRLLAIVSCVSLLMMFIGAIGTGALAGKTGFGVVERFSTYSAVIYSTFLSVYGFKINMNEELK